MRLLGRGILGFVIATIITAVISSFLNMIEVLTGIPIGKAWLSSGFGGIATLIIYIVSIYKFVKKA